MVDDARHRTKTWLDTYLTAANLTRDDGTTQLSYITAFGNPPYPWSHVLYDPKNVDLVYSIFSPETVPIVDSDGTIIGYNESVGIRLYTVKKQGRDPNKVLWKGEAELRRIAETYPLGSYRSVRRVRPSNLNMGGWVLQSVEYTLTYERDTT